MAERDAFSLAALRNEVIPIDDILEKELADVEVVAGPYSIVKDGMRGSRITYSVQSEDGSFTVDQTGLVDPATTQVYFFIVGCDSRVLRGEPQDHHRDRRFLDHQGALNHDASASTGPYRDRRRVTR